MQGLGNMIAGLYDAYAFETITVSSTAIGFTAATYNPAGAGSLQQVQYVLITSETNDIRYRIDGGTPTTAVGHLLESGSSMVIIGYGSIIDFRAIATGSDATLQVTYER